MKTNISITVLMAAILITALSFVMPKNKEKYLGDMFWSRKTFAAPKFNVVVMGDSRVYRGVSPEIMDQHLNGLKVLNFGYSNGGLNSTMFKAALSKFNAKSKTKVLVLGVSANAITDYTKNNDQYLQELTRPREEVLERIYLNPLLYWFSATTPEKLKESFQPIDHSYYYLSNYHMNGYVESDKFPADTTEAIASYEDDFNKYQVNENTLATLFEQVHSLVQQGITVIAYRPPVSQPMRELEDSMGNYNEALLQQRLENAGAHWISVNPNQYKTYDGSHMDQPSAERFSRDLADSISLILRHFE
ncbi:MAG: hypothetical protein ACERKD_15800 [Prolixibacteraceae bacterium]